jgi:hypothetical protein
MGYYTGEAGGGSFLNPLMVALESVDDGNADFLLEAAGSQFRVLLVQPFPLKRRIDPFLNRLPKPWTLSDCQGDVVHVAQFADHAV